MKSRITIYVLIFAVVAVWGFVAWKVFFARPAAPSPARAASQARTEENEPDERLLLDYPDPFLKEAGVTKTPAPPGIRTSPAKPAPLPKKTVAPPLILPFAYTGTVTAGNSRLYIFEYAEQQRMLAPNDELAGYRLAETYTDSVRFSKDGEFFTVHFQN